MQLYLFNQPATIPYRQRLNISRLHSFLLLLKSSCFGRKDTGLKLGNLKVPFANIFGIKRTKGRKSNRFSGTCRPDTWIMSQLVLENLLLFLPFVLFIPK